MEIPARRQGHGQPGEQRRPAGRDVERRGRRHGNPGIKSRRSLVSSTGKGTQRRSSRSKLLSFDADSHSRPSPPHTTFQHHDAAAGRDSLAVDAAFRRKLPRRVGTRVPGCRALLRERCVGSSSVEKGRVTKRVETGRSLCIGVSWYAAVRLPIVPYSDQKKSLPKCKYKSVLVRQLATTSSHLTGPAACGACACPSCLLFGPLAPRAKYVHESARSTHAPSAPCC